MVLKSHPLVAVTNICPNTRVPTGAHFKWVEKIDRLKMDVVDKKAAKLQRFMIVDGHVDAVGGGDTSVAMTTYGEDQGGRTNTDYGDKLQNFMLFMQD